MDLDQLRLLHDIASCVDCMVRCVQILLISNCAASSLPWATLRTFVLNHSITKQTGSLALETILQLVGLRPWRVTQSMMVAVVSLGPHCEPTLR